MSGQVQIRDTATAWTDHYTDPRGAAYRGAVPAAISFDAATSPPARKTGAGKHRAVRSSYGSAIKRAYARSVAVLAPQPAIPAGSAAAGSNSNSVDPTIHGTAPIRPAEIAARHDQPSSVRWVHAYTGDSTPVDAISATGAARAVAARHDYISDAGHTVYGSESGRVQHVQATPLDDAAVARSNVLTVPGRDSSRAASASEPSTAQLYWRTEWLESRKAQVPQRPSTGQVILRQDPSVPSAMGR